MTPTFLLLWGAIAFVVFLLLCLGEVLHFLLRPPVQLHSSKPSPSGSHPRFHIELYERLIFLHITSLFTLLLMGLPYLFPSQNFLVFTLEISSALFFSIWWIFRRGSF